MIGEGSFGNVYRAIHRTTKVVRAVKRVEYKKETSDSLSEYIILKKLVLFYTYRIIQTLYAFTIYSLTTTSSTLSWTFVREENCSIVSFKREIWLKTRVESIWNNFFQPSTTVTLKKSCIEIWNHKILCFSNRMTAI